MATGGSDFRHVLEGDEIARFLQQFVMPEAARQTLRDVGPKAEKPLPQNADQVFEDVKAIWQQHGFQTPAELKMLLIEKYLPGADPAVTAYVRQIERARDAPEATTGYLGKEHAYIATGLAHLYALETARPVALFEADFSNMGGTNNYFAALLEQEGRAPADAAAQGKRMTDAAVRLLCNSLLADAGKALPEGGKVIPIRTGGDEIRLLITGIDDRKKLQRLLDVMHSNIEVHVAGMGLQDHAHLKAPDDPKRNGFGAALAMQDMRYIRDPQTLVQELDAAITQTKNELGLARLGKIDAELVEIETRGRLDRGDLKLRQNQTAEDAVHEQIAVKAASATMGADYLHILNPVHNQSLQGGSKGFNRYVATALPGVAPPPPGHRSLPRILTETPPVGTDRPRGVEPLAPLEDRWHARATEAMASHGVRLNAADEFMLHLSISGLAAKDPSAQTFMPGIVGLTVEAYAAETPEFRHKWNEADADVQAALKKVWLNGLREIKPHAVAVSFHNIAGLNSALGHHQADLVLRHLGNEIIEASLAQVGIPSQAPKPYAVAHHGGGNFSIMVQPGGTDENGKPWFTSVNEMRKVEVEIAQRTLAMNDMSVAHFLASKGVVLSDDAKKKLPKTFGDIEDPKMREVAAADGAVIKGKVDGLHATTASAPMAFRARDLEKGVDGFGFMGRLRNEADSRMETYRQVVLLERAAPPSDIRKAFLDRSRPIVHIPEKPKPKLGPEDTQIVDTVGGKYVAKKYVKPQADAADTDKPKDAPVVEAKSLPQKPRPKPPTVN